MQFYIEVLLLWVAQSTSSTRHQVFLLFCKTIWLFFCDGSLSVWKYLQPLTGYHFEMSRWYPQQHSSSDLLEPVAHPMVDNMVNHSLILFPTPPFSFLFSPSPFSSSSSSAPRRHPHLLCSLDNNGGQYCNVHLGFIVLKHWFVSELIIG